jgi:spermidine synthase
MITQIMVSALPLLMHPSTAEGSVEVLLVGWGSGVSAGAALTFPLRSMDVIELEKATVDASRNFADLTNFEYTLDEFPYVVKPRLRILANDGRNYLSSGLKKYDVIISEPSNPWITGVSNLFTLDHFKTARENLKPGGIFCQWVQLYEMSPASICSIFKSFAYAFPYVAVFGSEPGSTDTLMLGSMDPFRFDLERAGRLMRDEQVKQLMLDAGIDHPLGIFSGILFGSRSEITGFCDFAPVNTDDNAYIEFRAPKDLIAYQAYRDYLPTFYDPEWNYGSLDALLDEFGDTAVEKSENYSNLALALAEGRRKRLAGKYIVKAKKQADTEMSEMAVLVLGFLMSDENEPETAFGLPVIGPEIDDETKKIFEKKYSRILKLIEKKDCKKAFSVLLELPEEFWRFSDSEFQFLTAFLEHANDRSEDAAERMEAILARKDGFSLEHPEIYYYLAKAYYNAYNERKAVQEMKNYVLLRLAKKLADKAGG